MKIAGGKALLTFDHAPSGLRTVDVDEAKGFAICGADKKWVWAKASIIGGSKKGTNQIEVSSPVVAAPVAVRYAWGDNPVCNVFSIEGLPLTPFRTDDFPMTTDAANPNGLEAQAAKRQEEIKATALKRAEALKQRGAAKAKSPK
jgi:sialate O-acetylesterase